MSLARGRALRFALAAALVAGALGFAAVRRQQPVLAALPPNQRPTLLLLTSLPLMFSEEFSLSGGGSPALRRLQAQYRVVPVGVADGAELARGRLLLMAQPPAQTAENLVVLDEWVRRGGHLLLLADPLLEWPSKRPIGDPLRLPPMFMDTGLLAHWGLRLDAPDERGPARRALAGYGIMTASPGSLSGSCAISNDRLVAHCRIGRGSATVVADADFLDIDEYRVGAEHNLDGLLAELAKLQRR
ncbi:MAG: hypothetical protein ACJ8FS_07960 [Sphingomicrobium sp.]